MIDGEATVKSYRQRDGHVWLMPANPAFEPIPGDDATIIGPGGRGPAPRLDPGAHATRPRGRRRADARPRSSPRRGRRAPGVRRRQAVRSAAGPVLTGRPDAEWSALWSPAVRAAPRLPRRSGLTVELSDQESAVRVRPVGHRRARTRRRSDAGCRRQPADRIPPSSPTDRPVRDVDHGQSGNQDGSSERAGRAGAAARPSCGGRVPQRSSFSPLDGWPCIRDR